MSVLTAVSSATPLHSVSTRSAHTPAYVQTDIKVVAEGFVLVCPFTLSKHPSLHLVPELSSKYRLI